MILVASMRPSFVRGLWIVFIVFVFKIIVLLRNFLGYRGCNEHTKLRSLSFCLLIFLQFWNLGILESSCLFLKLVPNRVTRHTKNSEFEGNWEASKPHYHWLSDKIDKDRTTPQHPKILPACCTTDCFLGGYLFNRVIFQRTLCRSHTTSICILLLLPTLNTKKSG